jgi:hypothetical protein
MRAHYEEQDLPMPDHFFPPDLPDGAGIYIEAFNRLVDDRPLAIGMAGVITGRIPFASIDRYARRAGIDDPGAFALFDRIIRALDGPDVASLNEKINK